MPQAKPQIRVLVQPSPRRVFADDEFAEVGAELTDDLSPANLILGVKQVPIKNLLPDRTYMFFRRGPHFGIAKSLFYVCILATRLKRNLRTWPCSTPSWSETSASSIMNV